MDDNSQNKDNSLKVQITHLPNDPMLNIWLNIKTIIPRRESKICECHATAFAFLRLWYKFEVRKFFVLSNLLSHKIVVPEFDRNKSFTRKANRT